MTERPGPLPLNAWAVLALLADDGPAHGFALAKQLTRTSPIGRAWSVSRPLVYRALDQLADQGYAEACGEEPGDAGPARQVYAATVAGRAAHADWLVTPVDRLRDVRAALVLKLVLVTRTGGDPRPLVDAQRRRLAAAYPPSPEPLDVVDVWRDEVAAATHRILDRVLDGEGRDTTGS